MCFRWALWLHAGLRTYMDGHRGLRRGHWTGYTSLWRGSLSWALPLRYKLLPYCLSWLGTTVCLTELQSLQKADHSRTSTIPFKVKPKLSPFASDIWCLVFGARIHTGDDWMEVCLVHKRRHFFPGTRGKDLDFHLLPLEILCVFKPRAFLRGMKVSFEFLAARPPSIAMRGRETATATMVVGVGPLLSGLFSLLNDIVEKHNEALLTDLIDDLGYWWFIRFI